MILRLAIDYLFQPFGLPNGESPPELKDDMPPYDDKDFGAEGIFIPPLCDDESPFVVVAADWNGLG